MSNPLQDLRAATDRLLDNPDCQVARHVFEQHATPEAVFQLFAQLDGYTRFAQEAMKRQDELNLRLHNLTKQTSPDRRRVEVTNAVASIFERWRNEP